MSKIQNKSWRKLIDDFDRTARVLGYMERVAGTDFFSDSNVEAARANHAEAKERLEKGIIVLLRGFGRPRLP